MQTISDSEDAALLLAVTGSPEQYLEKNRLQRLGSRVFVAEHILSTMQYMTWSNTQQAEPAFQDWQQLVQQSSKSLRIDWAHSPQRKTQNSGRASTLLILPTHAESTHALPAAVSQSSCRA